MDEKRCSRCGETKPVDQFYLRNKRTEKRLARCTSCLIQTQREYRIANPKHYDEYHARYRVENKPKAAAAVKKWAVANKDRIAENRKKWRAENRGRARELNRQSEERRRSKKLGVEDSLTDAQWQAILATHLYLCAYCGAPWKHMDHVVPLSKGGANAAHNSVPACTSCNTSKGNKDLLDWYVADAGHLSPIRLTPAEAERR